MQADADIPLRLKLERAAQQLCDHPFQCWFYGDSIGFEGLVAASELLDRPEWRYFSLGFARAWARRDRPRRLMDNTAPGHVMCKLAARAGETEFAQALKDLADHLYERPRLNGVSVTFENAADCLVTPLGPQTYTAEEAALAETPGGGVYLDCMHFDPPFYASLSNLTGDPVWADRAIAQLSGYRQLLFNRDLGLYRHFFLEASQQSYIDGWGRGQGWALLGLLDVVEELDSAAAGYSEVVADAVSLSDRMRAYQLDEGDWYSLVHDPESGRESSTAAFMATAFYRGLRLGILPADEFADAADRAFVAATSHLDDDGLVHGVTVAVESALIQEHYRNVPQSSCVPWGHGPLLTAALERRRVNGDLW